MNNVIWIERNEELCEAIFCVKYEDNVGKYCVSDLARVQSSMPIKGLYRLYYTLALGKLLPLTRHPSEVISRKAIAAFISVYIEDAVEDLEDV